MNYFLLGKGKGVREGAGWRFWEKSPQVSAGSGNLAECQGQRNVSKGSQ